MKVKKSIQGRSRDEVLGELRALCGREGVTRKDVAEQMGTSISYISHVLWGRTQISDAQLRRMIGAINDLAENKQQGSHGHGG